MTLTLAGKILFIMADYNIDISNSLKVFLCWVNDDFEICKKFLSFYEIPHISSKTILNFLMDILTRYQVTVDLCREQCYDGASNMLGRNSRVAKLIFDLQA